MASTARHQATAPAPWRAQFEADVAAMDSPEFVLATVTPNPASSSSPATHTPTPLLPRARYCIYRGMWAALPENKHNKEPRNPVGIYDSDLPTFTTDVRMHKVADLFATGPGHAQNEAQMAGSGGGGPVEAVWWCKANGRQWRIRGTAWVMATDVEDESGDHQSQSQGQQERSGVRSLKSEVGRRMHVLDGSRTADWSWAKELRGHFGNLSPGMRGTFKNPPPGMQADGEPDSEHQLGQKVDNTTDPVALANFRVVIIRPDEVETVDLNDPTTARRHRYTFREEGGEGKEQEEDKDVAETKEKSGSADQTGSRWVEEVQWP